MEQRKEICFNGQNIYVGLDVHLKSWSVTVMSENATLRKFSQDADPLALHKFLTRTYPGAQFHSVYEAGFCGFWAHRRLEELGIHNIVVNPADVPTTSGERIRKTDAVDSNKLARSLRSGDLRCIYIPSEMAQEMRSLTRLRESVTKDQTRQKNRIKSFLRYMGIEIPDIYSSCCWSKNFVTWLKEVESRTAYSRQALDFLIRQYESLRAQRLDMILALRRLSQEEPYKDMMRLLITVPGIGQIAAMTIISEIGTISRFSDADHLASYIGMIPMCHASGEHNGTGDITVRKNGKLRSLLIEASWIAVRKDPALTLAYETYRKRMESGKAIVKIARKLVNRIYYVMKHGKEYVPCVVE